MNILAHPEEFKGGLRVLLLKGRYKDGLSEQRCIVRISRSEEEFEHCLSELDRLSWEGERIYASAADRHIGKAIRLFRERQLASEYDSCPEEFYLYLKNRWISCLMAENGGVQKIWMFDCASAAEEKAVRDELRHLGVSIMYDYPSKNGHHILTYAFNRSELSNEVRALIETNPLMLWGY